MQTTFAIHTSGPGLHEFTGEVLRFVSDSGIQQGLLTLFVQHTSCSLMVQENADPDVQIDLINAFDRLAPEERRLYVHPTEGPDDMPAHVRTALTQVNLSIPLLDARLALGTWQGVFLFEHRHQPYTRHVVMHLMGE